MKIVLAAAVTFGFLSSTAAFAVQGPPSMSAAQAAAYEACIKKYNKSMPDINITLVLAKVFAIDNCAMKAGK